MHVWHIPADQNHSETMKQFPLPAHYSSNERWTKTERLPSEQKHPDEYPQIAFAAGIESCPWAHFDTDF